MACSQYRVDLTASFGTCVCGYKKTDHDQSASSFKPAPKPKAKMSPTAPVQVTPKITRPKVTVPKRNVETSEGPCSNYRVDLTASFGTCLCGFKRAEHTNTADTTVAPSITKSKGHHKPFKPLIHPVHPLTVPKEEPYQQTIHPMAPNTSKDEKTVESKTQVLTKQPAAKKQNRVSVVALYEFNSSREGDLPFAAGDIIKEVEKMDGGWWKGVCKNGKSGLFPKDYVKEIVDKGTDNDVESEVLKPAVSVPIKQNNKSGPIVKKNIAEPSIVNPKPVKKWESTKKTEASVPAVKPAKKWEPPKKKLPIVQPVRSTKVEEKRSNIHVRELSQKFAKLHVPVGPETQKFQNSAQLAIKQRRYRGLFDFDGDPSLGDLPFKEGDIVTFLEEVDAEWFKCENDTGKSGICPRAYLEEIKTSSEIKASSVVESINVVKPPAQLSHKDVAEQTKHMTFVKASFDFPGEQQEDIQFNANDIILIIEDIDESWYKGRVVSKTNSQRKEGLFPKNFVVEISKEEVPYNILAELGPGKTETGPVPQPRDISQLQHSLFRHKDNIPIRVNRDNEPIPPPRDSIAYHHSPPPPPSKEEHTPPPPPRQIITLKEGRTQVRVERSFQERGAAKPPAPWYSDGDTYSCKISLQTRGGAKTKIENFNITKQDRSKVALEVVQNSGDMQADVTADVVMFKPYPDDVLEASAKYYGPKIVAYAESKIGTRDGNGECWTLGANALKSAGTQDAIGLNFGQEIELSQVYPGDILQFKLCKFVFPGGSKSAGSPDHTSIVTHKLSNSKFEVLEQNPKPVSVGTYDIGQLTEGTVKAFRPLPKEENIDTIKAMAGTHPPPPPFHNKLAKALYDFTAQEQGDLTFREGDVIVVTSVDGEWSEGYLEGHSPGSVGNFPSVYVQIL